MFHRADWTRRMVALVATTALMVTGGMALAQFPGGPPPGGPPPGAGGGPGGPGRGFGPGGPGGPGRGRMSVVELPASILQAGLKLTDSQKTKITHIQDQFRKSRQELMPLPEEPPADPESMRDTMDKMRSLHQQAMKDIEAVLTASQKKAIPGVMRDARTFHDVGIPAELMGSLKLTADQKQQLASIAQQAQQEMRKQFENGRQGGDPQAMQDIFRQSRQQTHEKAMAVLTDSQQEMVTKYLEEHPRPEPGAGFGPPPGAPGDGPPTGPPPGGPPPDAPGDDSPDGPPPPAPPTF